MASLDEAAELKLIHDGFLVGTQRSQNSPPPPLRRLHIQSPIQISVGVATERSRGVENRETHLGRVSRRAEVLRIERKWGIIPLELFSERQIIEACKEKGEELLLLPSRLGIHKGALEKAPERTSGVYLDLWPTVLAVLREFGRSRPAGLALPPRLPRRHRRQCSCESRAVFSPITSNTGESNYL